MNFTFKGIVIGLTTNYKVDIVDEQTRFMIIGQIGNNIWSFTENYCYIRSAEFFLLLKANF